MGKYKQRIEAIKYVVNHHRKTMEEIVGENTDNPYASGILEAYRQISRTIERMEEQDDRNESRREDRRGY